MSSEIGPDLRVLVLIDTLRIGGPARVAVTLATGLRARGWDVRVMHLGIGEWQPLVAELRAGGVPVLNLAPRGLADPRAVLRLASCLRRQRIQVLHTHNRYAHLLGRPAAVLARCPVVSTDHWIAETDLGWRGAIRRTLDDLSARACCSTVIAVSEAQRRVYQSMGRFRGTLVETIPNGVDTERFRPDPTARARLRAELGIAEAVPLLATATPLRPGKGVGYLLEAVAVVRERVSPIRLVVAGDGAERSALEARAAALGLRDVVVFPGMRSDVHAILAAADVYVQPSLFEALPTSVLEAMAVGLAVVATNVGGVPEIVADGRTGLLVPPACAEGLATALARLLDPDLRTRLGRAGRAWVEANASSEVWLDRLEDVYGRAVEAAGPRGRGRRGRALRHRGTARA